jgi:hypothetical protein
MLVLFDGGLILSIEEAQAVRVIVERAPKTLPEQLACQAIYNKLVAQASAAREPYTPQEPEIVERLIQRQAPRRVRVRKRVLSAER